MPRRKDLKHIASALCGSFISRYNDVGGYWGIGKLCLLSYQYNHSSVCIDLFHGSISPYSDEFSQLIADYKAFVSARIAAKAIPEAWVLSIVIELDFDPPYPHPKHIPVTTWGKLFQLSVGITDDHARSHRAIRYGYCAPHDPQKELKSGRTYPAR